jgi:hypothetical protein
LGRRRSAAIETATGAGVTPIVTKMSKRYKNVVNPDDVVIEFGADSLRLYEMFMGPLRDTKVRDVDRWVGVGERSVFTVVVRSGSTCWWLDPDLPVVRSDLDSIPSQHRYGAPGVWRASIASSPAPSACSSRA